MYEDEPLRKLSKAVTAEIRLGFVRKVYGILTIQLLLTAGIAIPFQFASRSWLQTNTWMFWVSLSMGLALLLGFSCCPQALRRAPTNYVFLLIFTVCEGVLVGVVSA